MNLGQLAAALAVGLGSTRASDAGPGQILAVTTAGGIALLVTVIAVGPRLLRIDLRSLFAPPTARHLLLAAQAGLALWLLSIVVNLVNIALFGPNPQALVVTFTGHRGAEAIALDMLAGVAVAPIAEETLYRGILFGGLAQRLPFAPAAAISAAAFAAVHGLGVALPIFVLGLGLAWVYARTGSLWTAIVTHGVVNAISLTVLFAARPS